MSLPAPDPAIDVTLGEWSSSRRVSRLKTKASKAKLCHPASPIRLVQ